MQCAFILYALATTPPFASKQTFTRIGFLRSGGRLVTENGTHNVKKRAENFTKADGWTS